MTNLDEISAALAAVGVALCNGAYLFSNDPAHARPWNPDWVTRQIAAAADAAGVDLDIKGGRHYAASQVLVSRPPAAHLLGMQIKLPHPASRRISLVRHA